MTNTKLMKKQSIFKLCWKVLFTAVGLIWSISCSTEQKPEGAQQEQMKKELTAKDIYHYTVYIPLG